jgi:hypothetical protein
MTSGPPNSKLDTKEKAIFLSLVGLPATEIKVSN